MKHLFYQALAAFAITSVIIANTPAMIRTINGEGHMDRFFVIRQMEVDSYTPFGQWPTLYYDRKIKNDFSADWTATVQKINSDGTFSYFCAGRKHNEYKKGISLPKEKLSLAWLVNNDPSCDKLLTTSGEFRAVVLWNPIDRGPYYMPTKFEYVTNVFKILAPGEELNEQTVTK